MDGLYCRIPMEYLVVKEEWYSDELKKIPLIRAGHRRGNEVYRIYSEDLKSYREISRSSSRWDKAKRTCDKCDRIREILSVIRSLKKESIRRKSTRSYCVKNLDNKYGIKFYESLIDGSCPTKNDSKYCYKGRSYRSRAEMVFAILLDELGLEFKYDVLLKIDGKDYTVDFVIVFKEFNRCIFIEYFGACQDRDRNRKNSLKVEHFANDGIYPGRDLFIFSGDEGYMPGKDMIKGFLIAIIASLCDYHIGFVEE